MGITEDVKRARTGEEGTDPSAESRRRRRSLARRQQRDEWGRRGIRTWNRARRSCRHRRKRSRGSRARRASRGRLAHAARSQRFVYAAYFAGAIAIAFLMSKVLDFAWYKPPDAQARARRAARRDHHARSPRSSAPARGHLLLVPDAGASARGRSSGRDGQGDLAYAHRGDQRHVRRDRHDQSSRRCSSR